MTLTHNSSMNLLAKPIKMSLIYKAPQCAPPTNLLTYWESASEDEFVLILLMPL